MAEKCKVGHRKASWRYDGTELQVIVTKVQD